MTNANTPNETGTNLIVGALLGVAGAGLLLWVAGGLSALVCGHRWPHAQLVAGYGALAHPGDPSRAWRAPVGPPGVYWTITVLVLAVVAALAVLAWRMLRADLTDLSDLGRPSRDPNRLSGLATRHDVKAAAGRKALLRRAGTLRASLQKPTAADVGYQLGVSRGVACWVSVEDSIVVLGPPRSGKGVHTVIPAILDAPGAVVTTSTRPDNLATTITARTKLGPVAVFDPQRLAPGVLATTKWSPVRGCEDPQTAMIRARALCSEPAEGVEHGTFWSQQCFAAVRCLLHAAALEHRPAAELYRWSLSPAAAKDASEILNAHPAAAPAWGRALAAILAADPRQRDSVWAMVANSFAPLADPRVLEAVSPGEGEGFDPVRFLRERGTVYLLGTATGAAPTAGLVAAFLEDVVEAARRLAAVSEGARLDPPLALILDEAANYPLPSLPSLMSDGGGSGITTLAVLQSLAQARGRWGRDGAAAIWDAAIVKLILGGGGNADDLRDLSALLGTRVQRRTATNYGGTSGRSYSESLEEKPILDPAELRMLAFGHGLLLLRAAPPIMLTLTPWMSRPAARELAAARAGLEQQIRGAHADPGA